MISHQARETAAAVGLTLVGLACAAWLLVKAFQEISAGVALPRGAR
ncbi:hypothetical protein [Modestobacter sp. VKM Ac-2985]|nr:hypothetical protein [Modestobacter sp. VKM Ac-2985]MCZ2837177.1 hypothetical protein [Modestobacter sp. VKM Ac-2985]